MANKKLKILFIVLVAAYAVYGFIGAIYFSYIEMSSLNAFINKSLWMLIVVSVITGGGIFLIYTKLFESTYKSLKFLAKMVIPFAIVAISYGVNRGYVKLVNSFSASQSIVIHGKIKEKYFDETRKSRTYFLKVEDSASNKIYVLLTKKIIYLAVAENDIFFSKEFKKGLLGIIFRKDE